jgi:hypothetical protein
MSLRIAASLLLIVSPLVSAAGFPAGAYTSGDMTLTFADHGMLQLAAKNEVVMTGTWTADATTLTVTDQSGPYACAAPNAAGVYAWKSDPAGVTFTKRKDGCDDRAQALGGTPWKRKS